MCMKFAAEEKVRGELAMDFFYRDRSWPMRVINYYES